MAIHVNKKLCSTCIFSSESPIQPERFQELESIWNKEGIQQECHHATIKGKHIACRGYFEAYKRGEYQFSKLEAAAAQIGLAGLPPADLVQILERLNLIQYIDCEGTNG